ncbi:MAG: hypothetical protein HGA45_43625, partial [Chloroflexales bacterium]|nr:hypothetical protein [Chloroflexales bacterium]
MRATPEETMSESYSEQDTERARTAERSSAGMSTQQLSLPSATGAAGSLPAARGRPNMVGLILVGLGALLLLSRLGAMPLEITGGMVLLTIASVFYFFGFWRHIYGLIIPASILAGLSVGVTFADVTDGVSVLWGLALGFLTIYGLGAAMFGQRSPWPAIPAVILFAVGSIVAVANLPAFLGAGLIWAPLLLIAAG